MDEVLENRVNKLKTYGEKPIGVFGARASGKTMFFTILYGLTGFKDEQDQFSVLCKDEETRKYLSNNYSYVSRGDLLPRTEITLMRKIVMDFVYNQSDYSMKSFDFAGELLKENSMEEKVLADVFLKRQKKIYEFFASCSAILIFIDPSEDDSETFKRQDEVNKLLGYLKDENGVWSKSIPIALVITKWDKVSQGKNEVVEKKKAIDYIQNHRVYKNIYNILQGASDTVDIFPLSAFGESKDGDLPPDDLNQPFNLFAPMVWISHRRDIDWKNKIKQVFKEEKINAKDAKDIIKDYMNNVRDKELVKEVDKIYKKYLAKGRNKVIGLIALLIVIIGGSGAGYFIYSEKNKESFEFNKVLEISNKIEQIQAIDNFRLKYGEESENSKKLILKLKDAYKEAIDLENDINQKEILINQFEERYTDSESQEFIRTRKAVLSEEKKQNEILQRKRADADSEYKLLETIWKDNSASLKKYEYSKAFITNYPDYRLINIVKENAAKYLKLADRELYDEIVNYNSNSNKNLNVLYEKIETYLVKADFKEYKAQVSNLKDNLKEEEYFDFVKTRLSDYNKAPTKTLLLNLSNSLENYMKNSKQKKYETFVKKYQEQITELNKGQDTELELYVDISDFTKENAKVEIRANPVTSGIIFKSKDNISGKQRGMQYIGADGAKISLDTKVEVIVYVTTPDNKEYLFGPQVIALSDMNNGIIVKDTKSNSIKVELRTKKEKFNIK